MHLCPRLVPTRPPYWPTFLGTWSPSSRYPLLNTYIKKIMRNYKTSFFNILTTYMCILMGNFCKRLVPLTQILSSCSSVAYKTCVCTLHVRTIIIWNFTNKRNVHEILFSKSYIEWYININKTKARILLLHN